MPGDVISFDLETYLITRLEPAPKPVCVSWDVGAHPSVSKEVHAVMLGLLDGETTLVGHNVAYDFGVLLQHFPTLRKVIFRQYRQGLVKDTMIRQQLFDIAAGRTRDEDDALRKYSLASLVELIFDRSIAEWKGGPDAWRLRYAELDDVALRDWPEAAVEYPKVDARETLAVYDEQQAKVGHLLQEDAFQAYAAFCLALKAANGVRTCASEIAEVETKWRAKLEELIPPLKAEGLLYMGGTKKAPRLVKKDKSARERMLAVCKEKGLEVMLTDAGRERERKGEDVSGYKYVSIDRSACLLAGDELLNQRADYVLAEKILSTYVPALKLGVDGPLTTSYQMAATTRTTSSKPREPAVGTNLQNAPNRGGIRECIIPREGHVFIGGDLSGAELHCLAQACKRILGFSALGDALNEGQDVHCRLGARMAGRDYEPFYKEYKDGCPVVKEWRSKAKAGNFGYGGLMGPAGFVRAQLRKGSVFSLEEAAHIRDSWLTEWPEMQEYFRWVKEQMGPTGNVVMEMWPGGPFRRFRKATQLANSLFQGPAARGAKQAICDLTYKYYCDEESSLYLTSRPSLFIHDEIVTESLMADANTLHERVLEFKTTVENAFNTMVPDYPTTVDPGMSIRGYKCEPHFDEKGRFTWPTTKRSI